MTHGYPDWGGAAPLATVYSVQDLAELAARLGSIVTHDRRGNVILLDDLGSGIRGWQSGGSGSGYAFVWSSEYARNGAFCAKLTGGSSFSRNGYAIRELPYPTIGKLGYEVSFDLSTDVEYFETRFDLYDGTTLHHARVKFTASGGVLAYEDSNTNWQTLASGLYVTRGGLLFNTVKIVADFVNQVYSRVICNESSHDLSDIAYFTEPDASSPKIEITLLVKSNSGKNGICYFDDLIVTQNES